VANVASALRLVVTQLGRVKVGKVEQSSLNQEIWAENCCSADIGGSIQSQYFPSSVSILVQCHGIAAFNILMKGSSSCFVTS
jgi:hypothetical protein